jgi:hypothetical protein
MKFIAALLLLANVQIAIADGYGEWKFGMSRDEVKAVSDSGPYYSLPNNDLGSQSGYLETQKVPISFYFGEDQLSRMMLIAYQGEDSKAAVDAWKASLNHLAKNFEGIELGTNRGVAVSVEAAMANLEGSLETLPVNGRVQAGALPMPSNVRVWATFTKATDSIYMVAVNYAAP